jgi:four helix bundle protein
MRDFHKLAVWEKAHALTLTVYRAPDSLSNDKWTGLAGQIGQVAGAIPSQIAEGCGYEDDADLVRFLHAAIGSTSKLEYFLLLAHDLGGLRTGHYDPLAQDADEVKRMLAAFVRRLTT